MRCVVVDIGSNSVKMNIYDMLYPDGKVRLDFVLYETRPVKLINYVNNKIMSADGIRRLCLTLLEFRGIYTDYKADKIFHIATASLRNIINKADVLKYIKDALDIDIELIDGVNEAMYAYNSLKYILKDSLRAGMIIDMGGGSTELIKFDLTEPKNIESLPFGCLSLYKSFVSGNFPNDTETTAINCRIGEIVKDFDWVKNNKTVYFIGGTGRSIARIHSFIFDIPDTVNDNNYKLSYDDLRCILSKFKNPSQAEYEILEKLVPDRITTIIPGLIAYEKLLEIMNAENIHVINVGIREGFLLEKSKE